MFKSTENQRISFWTALSEMELADWGENDEDFEPAINDALFLLQRITPLDQDSDDDDLKERQEECRELSNLFYLLERYHFALANARRARLTGNVALALGCEREVESIRARLPESIRS